MAKKGLRWGLRKGPRIFLCVYYFSTTPFWPLSLPCRKLSSVEHPSVICENTDRCCRPVNLQIRNSPPPTPPISLPNCCWTCEKSLKFANRQCAKTWHSTTKCSFFKISFSFSILNSSLKSRFQNIEHFRFLFQAVLLRICNKLIPS